MRHEKNVPLKKLTRTIPKTKKNINNIPEILIILGIALIKDLIPIYSPSFFPTILKILIILNIFIT